MSEFYVKGAFLSKDGLYEKYHSIINTISDEQAKVDGVIAKLKRYNGFGIESQVLKLKSYQDQLNDCQNDIRAEWVALDKIIDKINENENKAVGILGGISDGEYSFAEYDIPSEPAYGYFEAYKKFLEIFTDLGENVFKILEDLLDLDFIDISTGLPKELKELFGDYMGSAFDGLNIISKIFESYDFLSDGITIGDLLNLTDNSIGVFKSFGGVLEKWLGVKYFVKFGETTAKETGLIFKNGNVHWGDITGYLPAVSVLLSAAIGGWDKYTEYNQDGIYTTEEKCKTGAYAGVAGLMDMAKLIPYVGPVWAITDIVLKLNGIDCADLVTDKIFDTIDKETNDAKEQLNQRGADDPAFCQEYLSSSKAKQSLIYYSYLFMNLNGIM